MAAVLVFVTFTPGVKDKFFTLRASKRLHVIPNVKGDLLKELADAEDKLHMAGVAELSSGRVAMLKDGKPMVFETRQVLVTKGGMLSVLWLFCLFGLVGLAVGAAARRKIHKEVVVAGVAAIVLQLALWTIGAGGKVMLVLTGWVWIEGGTALIKMLPGLFVFTVVTLMVLSAVVCAGLGTTVVEQITKNAFCDTCAQGFSIKPKRPEVCPTCGTRQARGRIRWAWVAPAVAATLLMFGLTVRLLGPSLSFYWSCDFAKPSASCKKAIHIFNRARYSGKKDTGLRVWWKQDEKRKTMRGVILHQWKYIGFMAILFFFAPFVVAWRCRRAGLATAGVTLVLNWVGATITALTALDFGQFEGIFLIALRMHVIAGIVWCIAGLAGAFIGQKLGPSQLDLDIEEDAEA